MFGRIYKYLVVHVGGIKFGTTDKVVPFFPINNATEGFANFFLIELPRNLGLDFHDRIGPFLLYVFGNIVLQLVGMGIFLMAIGKTAQALKTHVPHPLFQGLKIFLGLSRITHDQGGSYGHFGYRRPEIL